MPLPSYHPYKKFPPVVDYEEVLWVPSSGLALQLAIHEALSGSIIYDISGNERNAVQETVLYQPAIVAAGLNGRNYIHFDGVDDRLIINSQFIVTNTLYVFAVSRVAATGYGGIITSKGSSADQSPALEFNATAFYEMNGSATTANQVAVASAANTDWVMLCGKLEGGYAHLSINGSSWIKAASAYGAFSGQVTTTAIGAYRNLDANFGELDLAELLVYTTPQEQTLLDKLFGRAAHLYGLTSTLPATHPYKFKPPVIEKPLNYFTAMNLEGR